MKKTWLRRALWVGILVFSLALWLPALSAQAATEVALPAAAQGLVWDGSVQTGVAAGEGYAVINGTGTAPGSYKATVSLTDKTNTVWQNTKDSVDQEVIWGIAPKPIPEPQPITGLVFDGTQKTGVAAGNDYTVSNGTGTTVGGYTATVSLTDKANTVWQHAKTNADQGIGWSIAPKPIPVPQPITGLVYDGAEKTGVAAGNGYTVSNGIGINAGSYTAKASLTDKMNTV